MHFVCVHLFAASDCYTTCHGLYPNHLLSLLPPDPTAGFHPMPSYFEWYCQGHPCRCSLMNLSEAFFGISTKEQNCWVTSMQSPYSQCHATVQGGCIYPPVCEGFYSPESPPTLGFSWFSNMCQPDIYEMMPYCFSLHFPDCHCVWATLHMLPVGGGLSSINSLFIPFAHLSAGIAFFILFLV